VLILKKINEEFKLVPVKLTCICNTTLTVEEYTATELAMTSKILFPG